MRLKDGLEKLEGFVKLYIECDYNKDSKEQICSAFNGVLGKAI